MQQVGALSVLLQVPVRIKVAVIMLALSNLQISTALNRFTEQLYNLIDVQLCSLLSK
jgi:hypothetical protein